VRSGGFSFDNFLELLRFHHSAGAWHFTPPQAQLSVGDVLLAINRGGETHAFTEVEEFGGGHRPHRCRVPQHVRDLLCDGK
jgi:hypothetical protein